MQCTNPPHRETAPGTDSDLLIDCYAIWPDQPDRHRDTTNQHRTGEK